MSPPQEMRMVAWKEERHVLHNIVLDLQTMIEVIEPFLESVDGGVVDGDGCTRLQDSGVEPICNTRV